MSTICPSRQEARRDYFALSPDGLYSPNDVRAPGTLLFDTRTWTPIRPVAVKYLHGLTHYVPRPMPADATSESASW